MCVRLWEWVDACGGGKRVLDPPRAGIVSGHGSSGKAQVLLTAESSPQPQNQSPRMNDQEN